MFVEKTAFPRSFTKSGTDQCELMKEIYGKYDIENRLNGQCLNKIGGIHLHHADITIHACYFAEKA